MVIGTGVAGLTDYFTRPEIDPSQERIMGRTQEELDKIEKDLDKITKTWLLSR